MGAVPDFFFFSSRRRHTRYWRDWSSDVCSSDLIATAAMASGLRYKGEPRIGQTFAVGSAMGFLSGAIGLGGPLIVLFWLGGPERAARVRSNIFAFFGAFSIVSLAGYWWTGLFTAPRLIGALALLPLYAGAMAIGSRLFDRSTDESYRRAAIALATMPFWHG